MKYTVKQFFEQQPATAEFYKKVKKLAPVHVDELKPLITYHPDREMCENYMWSMLGNLGEFRLLNIDCDGMVVVTEGVSNG
jgi:hypothetical protein